MRGFRSMGSLQKFASIHASLYNHFNLKRHVVARQIYKLRRTAAQLAWETRCGVAHPGITSPNVDQRTLD